MCDPRLALAYSEKLLAEKFSEALKKPEKPKPQPVAEKKPLARTGRNSGFDTTRLVKKAEKKSDTLGV